MGIRGRSVFVLGVCGLAMAWCAPAYASTSRVTVEHQQSHLVNASFSTVDGSDPTGCTYLEAFVTANAGVDHQTPSTSMVGDAAVSVDRFNACTGLTLFQAIGQTDSLSAGDFWISNQLDAASLHVSLTATDLDTGATFALRADVTFSGTSAISRDTENTNDLYSRSCHVLNRWKGSGRDATASGTVYAQGTNYTPAASKSGEIGWVHDGFEVIGCS